MSADISSELNRAYDELRGIDSEIATLSGRSQLDRGVKRRIVVDPGFDSAFSSKFNGNDRGVVETGGHRRIVVTAQNNFINNSTNNGIYLRKRRHFGGHRNPADSDEDDGSGYHRRNGHGAGPPAKRTLQSSVVVPIIETKSRAEILTEMKKSEKKEDVVRNQRLFSNLVVGTLKQFQKEEGTVKNRVQAQTEKQREIERRLELTDKENRERILKEKRELIERRREKELEIQRLKREKAITKYAEEKEQHFHRLQNFIQTQTKPPIFFLPAKHTLRTLELLKESAKKVEGLIALNREKVAIELQRDRFKTEDVHLNGESDVEEDMPTGGLKSAVVAVPKVEKVEAEVNDHK